ncbi:type II secretion system protein [Candidatus Vampirococcus lugosii]|uniref:Prepilin-type N-terminal cleavage/methylation domain-containing protein n=1 Tax=Candidatus Vampirococcus lugosii TaxID=2789015 RepID=A0ABS5QQP9_9BACT|nr:type II secretion system protein [Candidatus Vampirococcus lugosii]MBS8122494.1 hypothetical protein [Candidatus Vampirococcus lugosii]
MNKGFTLIEIMISVVILGLLIVIIFSVYNTVAELSIRIENEKNLSNELLFVSQNIQGFADSLSLDFSKYSDLDTTKGFTGSLYFTGNDFVNIYLTGDTSSDIDNIRNSKSWIEMNKNGEIMKLTDPNKIYIRNLNFKIIPFDEIRGLDFDKIYNQGFWIFVEAYTNNYSKYSSVYDISSNVQAFFNVRQY